MDVAELNTNFYLSYPENLDRVFAYFNSQDHCLVVAKKKSDELPRSTTSQLEWPKFVEAMHKEVPEILKSMRVLSLEESQQVKDGKPDRIIPSRFTSVGNQWKTKAIFHTKPSAGGS